MGELCNHWQDTADGLCHDYRRIEGDAHGHCHHDAMSGEVDAKAGEEGEDEAHQEGDPHLLPEHRPHILDGDLIDRHTTDDQSRALAAGVAPGIGEHRDEGDEDRQDQEGILKAVEDAARDHAADQEDHQPDDSILRQFKDPGLQVGLVTGHHRAHLLEVLGVLLLDDVDDVVNGDDTHQAVLMVHDGDGEQVVPAEEVGDHLLVVGGGNRDEVRVHQIGEDAVVIGEEEGPDRNDTLKLAVLRGDVTGVDRLLVLTDTPDVRDGLLDRHLLLELDELGGHDRTGCELRVEEELVDQGPCLGGGVLEDAVDEVGGQLPEHVDRVVDHQALHQLLQLLIGDGPDELLLMLECQVCKDLCRQVLVEGPEDNQGKLGGQALDEGSDIDLLQVREVRLQGLPIV